MPLFEQHNDIYEKLGNKSNLAIGLGNVAYMAQLPIGALRAAEANLRRASRCAGRSRPSSVRRLGTRNWAGCWPIAARRPSRKRNWRRR